MASVSDRSPEQAQQETQFLLPQVIDGFTLTNDHINVLPVVRQLVVGKFKQAREDIKIMADELLAALKASTDLRKLIAVWDIVLVDELEGQMIGTPY